MVSSPEEARDRVPETGLDRAGLERDPLAQFRSWYEQACAAGIPEPDAMILATATDSPSLRSVLMKGFDQDGFVFFTNHGSRKARQIRENNAVSALFPWYALRRQVIIEGHAHPIDADQSRAYFHSRPRNSQLGAWASRQSEPLASRQVLEEQMARITERFRDQEVPLPDFWGGYRIRPQRIEFWQGRTHRLHDRICYTRRDPSRFAWEISRLYP